MNLKWTYILNRSEQHLKKYRIEKRQAMIAYTDSDFKKFLSIHDRLALLLIDAWKKQEYPNGWQRGRLFWSKMTSKKKPSPATINRCLQIWKPTQREEIYNRFYAVNCFRKIRKDLTGGQEELVTNQHIFKKS